MEQNYGECRVSAAAGSSATVLEFPAAVVPRAQENDVEPINQYTFYELGADLHPLGEFIGDVPRKEAIFALWPARSRIHQAACRGTDDTWHLP